MKAEVPRVPLSSYAVSSLVRASVGRHPPNILAHGPVLVKPVPFPPRAHHHYDRRKDNHAHYAHEHDEVL